MKDILKNQIRIGNKEEIIPDYSNEFPYRSSRMHFDHYGDLFVPWHWHGAVELFYMEKGSLECYTLGQKTLFKEGMAGLVNSNILHSTKPFNDQETIQYVHLFDPVLIGGKVSSRIYKKYVDPVISKSKDVLIFDPSDSKQADIIQSIREIFQIHEDIPFYEMILREELTKLWMKIFDMIDFEQCTSNANKSIENNLKLMMLYINENLDKKLNVSEIANAGYTSERGCYRIFHEYLNTTPSVYVNQCRISEASRLLLDENESIATVALKAGFTESSHFSRMFKKETGMTPLQFRNSWKHT